jgi:hypothetical protein
MMYAGDATLQTGFERRKRRKKLGQFVERRKEVVQNQQMKNMKTTSSCAKCLVSSASKHWHAWDKTHMDLPSPRLHMEKTAGPLGGPLPVV